MNINVLMSRSGGLTAAYAIDELKKIIKPKMKVAIIGFSFFNNLSEEDYFNYYGKDSEYAMKMAELFKFYDVTDVNWIFYYKQSLDEQIKLINDADILYYPGGAPDLMFERIKEKNLLEKLKAFKGIIIGSSAGAMIQLETYHISKDNEYSKFSLNEGLGYINNFFIEVHYRRRKKQKSSLRKMNKTFKKPLYIIPDDGILIYKDNAVATLGSAKMAYDGKGVVK